MGVAIAGAVTCLLVLALVGGGPWNNGPSSVRATDSCRYVRVVRTLPKPIVTVRGDEIGVRTVPQRRVVRVKTCR